MKPCGAVRRIDELGRIVLPADVRKMLDLKNGIDSVEIFVDQETIIIKKYQSSCTFCGKTEKIIDFKGQKVCADCINKIGEILRLSE